MENISYKFEIFEGPLELLVSLVEKHKLKIDDIPSGMKNGKLTVTNVTTGETFTALCSLSERQQKMVLAGGLLNYTKEGGQ